MPDHLSFSKATYLFRAVLFLTALCLVGAVEAACGSSSTLSSNGQVHLTLWTWLPNADIEVKLFEQTHPNIKVTVVNAGQGAPEYTKLRTALKAGSGAPDDVLIEYQYLPTFIATGKLVDLSQYGADAIKNDFVPWTWNQVSQGSRVYAIPQDSAPLAFLYRKDIFDEYKISVPTTWAEYAAAAAKLHTANPKIYMGDFAPNDGSQVTALMWQAGSRPFKVNGTNVSININDAPAMKVAAYWDGLIKSGVVQAQPDFNTAWYSGFANGTYASWIGAAWGPVFLEGIAAQTAGKWRVAPLPQWNAGDTAAANWGGATNAVTTQSAHPKEAAELAMWVNDNKASATMLTQKQYLFPTLKSVLNDSSVIGAPVAFYGNQPVYKIFAAAASHVDTSFQWSPFQDYVYTQMSDAFGPAANGNGTLVQGMQTLQTNVVNYAKQQGFTVTNG
jgi:multiple sugar transport system substrate-binding protein